MKKILCLLAMLFFVSMASQAQSTDPVKEKTYVQCSALTVSGDRCARRTTNVSGKCTQHENLSSITPSEKKAESVQCIATTKEGVQCRNKTTDKSWKCWQHR